MLQAQPGWHSDQTGLRNSVDWVADTPIFGSDGSLIGVFFNDNARSGAASDNDLQDLLALYCAMVGRIAERKALEVENERLHREQVRGAAVAERSRLARELHDSVSQALFGIVLGVRTLKDNGLRNDALNTQALDYVFNLSESALSEMRSLVQALRPEVLERDGLRVALRHQAEVLCQRSGIRVTIDVGEIEPALSIEAKEALYRISLEAIQNVLKHASADDISVRMAVDADSVTVTITDNGLGFDPDKQRPGHYGQKIMRERAEEYGGTFSVDSRVGAGACVRVRLPLQPMRA